MAQRLSSSSPYSLPASFLLVGVFLALSCLTAGQIPVVVTGGEQQPNSAANAGPPDQLCAACVLAHMEFLAADALRGRGSATHDELVAATYVASRLRASGIEPAGDSGGYLQRVP